MEFLIADSFCDSLNKLTNDEQKAVKTTAFDLQMNPAHPGLKFHKLDKAKDANFCSIYVNMDIRLILHRTESSLLLCYVDHHDKAYEWARRRKLETHPKTGAAQIVEIRETVREIVIPNYVEAEQEKPALFGHVAEEELLGYGVPSEWLPDVKKATEDTLLDLTDHLPAEAAEALLNLATGTIPQTVPAQKQEDDPFAHPDAQRRFRVMSNVEELQRALDYPWEKWTVFLHPAQQSLIEQDFNGPARVCGTAGTGKTIVALHRAVYLARNYPEARVLLATFSEPLANALRTKLLRLISSEPRLGERIDVYSMDAIASRLYAALCGLCKIASKEDIQQVISTTAKEGESHKFTLSFLLSEWAEVVDGWQLDTWESYRDVPRLGRKTRLPEKQRAVLWSIFERARALIKEQGLVTLPEMYCMLTGKISNSKHPQYDFAVIDEAQDISVSQLRFLAALGGERANSLFFSGDLGQRIFQPPFSWKALGVDVRGRSKTLRINYRMSPVVSGKLFRTPL